MKKKLLSLLLLASMLMPTELMAQRVQQKLGRGVVAVYGKSNGSEGVTVTWRRLAQEPENAQYNVYVAKSADGEYKKLNSKLLSNTNYSSTLSSIPYGSYVAVTIVDGEKESEKSKPFLFKNNGLRNIYMEIRYDKSPLDKTKYTTKFVWPCDLNGDGEMDYVVDRLPVDGSRNRYVEGYLADGTFLWNVDLGPNEVPCDGQNDNMCAYDIDCDGYGELIVQTSDGTRFWDKEKGTWGKYVLGKTTGDSDGDGIIDYDSQATKNPPRYMTVVNGMTGEEKASAEFMYDDAYNRTNKAQLMGDEYNKHEAHVGIYYHDGVHPAICGEWSSRDINKAHHYRNCAFAYDFDAEGKATNWHQLFLKKTGGAVFHQIRIADVDGDGKDEMLSGAYAMANDGSTLYNTGIAHGDRHRTSDIDPEHPGLETFSIQQDAGDMLGQILFDAATGEPIKKWYLPAVGDVGRGECMDLDPNHLGWEMFSTMDGYQMFDAKGNKIEDKTGFFPTEGIWWDGQLDRERVDSPDGNGYNAMIVDYTNGRLIEMAKESGWTINSSNAKRGKFWGDIIGDWREELVLIRIEGGVCQGIVGFTTDYTTTVNNIYCLLQDPHYNGDCTTRGYYQSPNPGFYLGYDMPRPQLPPCMVADEENDVFGIALGNATISPRKEMRNVYAMPVKGQTLTISENIDGEANLWKSQLGTLVLNGKNISTGKTIISEGTLELNGEISGTVDLRARGTLAGYGLVDSLSAEGALNYEGGRLMPKGKLAIDKLYLPKGKKLYVEMAIDGNNVLALSAMRQANVNGTIIFTINDDLKPGRYLLIDGGNVAPEKCEVRGMTGKSIKLESTDPQSDCGEYCKQLYLVVNEQREATSGVMWAGTESNVWDYQAKNFSLNGEAEAFVAGDCVVFNDDAVKTSITLNELLPIGNATFANDTKTYTIQGDGGMTGDGDLVMNGKGKLVLNAVKSDYTGKTIINSGTVTVKDLAEAGLPSPIGAASDKAENFQIGKATLVINNSNAATNRQITLNDTATISVPSGTVALKGKIVGSGTLLKDGAGQLNITYGGVNAWAETILKAGTLAMGTWNTTFGKATSSIHVTGNSTLTVFDANSTSTVPNVQNTITIDKGKTLTFRAGSRCAIRGLLKGEGTYKISFPYVRGDVSTNTSNFEGTYQVTTSNCRFVQAMDLSKATLKLDDGAYAAGNKAGSGNEVSYTHKVGSLAGTGTLGTGTWNVGYLGNDDTFGGKFNASATVNKYGEGTLTLTGASEGAITVNEGTLLANCTTASTTQGAITVKADALLAGTGQVQNVTVQKNGMIGGGKGSATVGTLTVNGNLTVSTGGKIRIRYRSSATKTTTDMIKVAGKVKLTSPVIEFMSLNDTEILDDTEITLFKNVPDITVTGDVTIIPAQPKAGWKWDTSSLATDGILRIQEDPTAIGSISLEAIGDKPVYDLTGQRVLSPVKRGVYIIGGKKVFVK